MPKSEAGQVCQMITKGRAEYHILLQMLEVDAIKSAWYVPQTSNGKQLFIIVKRAIYAIKKIGPGGPDMVEKIGLQWVKYKNSRYKEFFYQLFYCFFNLLFEVF